METIELKNRLLRYIDTADERLLKILKAVVENYQEEDQKDTIEKYNQDIDKAIDEIEKGKFYTQEEVREIAKKW